MSVATRGYRTERVLAERAGVCVALVRDGAGRPFVVKQLVGAAEAAERLRAEARLLAAGWGPGVIRLHGAADDPPALLLEYAPGGSLAELLVLAGALRPREAVRIAARVADTVERLHARGIVHRDLKPSNVLLTADGEPRLADFGVAARVSSPGTLGDGWEELRVGTPPYAAPEHPSSRPAVDVFGLGVVLYEMLTGRLPWEPRVDESDGDFAARAGRERAVAPSARAAGIPRELEALVLQALRPRPEDRPASAAEFARRARRAVRGSLPRRVLAMLLKKISA